MTSWTHNPCLLCSLWVLWVWVKLRPLAQYLSSIQHAKTCLTLGSSSTYLIGQRRCSIPWCNRVDPYAIWSPLTRQVASELVESCLGHCIHSARPAHLVEDHHVHRWREKQTMKSRQNARHRAYSSFLLPNIKMTFKSTAIRPLFTLLLDLWLITCYTCYNS
jgi:hypothetical protein